MVVTLGLPTTSVTIANNASLSGSALIAVPHPDSLRTALVGIIVPSGWTTAAMTFQASNDDSTYYNLYNSAGAEVTTGSITGGTAVWVALDPADFIGVPYIKVRSGTSGTPVTQTGGDTLTLILRGIE